MSCGCENRTIMCVYRRQDGTYGFDKAGSEIDGKIVEFRHYL